MLKAIARAGLAVGFAYGVYSVARKFWGSEIDAALDRAKSTAKDIGSDLARKDKAVTNGMEHISRKAM